MISNEYIDKNMNYINLKASKLLLKVPYIKSKEELLEAENELRVIKDLQDLVLLLKEKKG